MKTECIDQFEAFYSKEDIVAIRRLIIRKKYKKKAIALAILVLYAILLFFRLPDLWNGSQRTQYTMYAFIDGMTCCLLILWRNRYSSWKRAKKLEISRCEKRHIEIKVFDGWFSVSQYFEDWKAGEQYVRPQDIDTILQDNNYTILLRDKGIICTLKNAWLEEHPDLGPIFLQNVSAINSDPIEKPEGENIDSDDIPSELVAPYSSKVSDDDRNDSDDALFDAITPFSSKNSEDKKKDADDNLSELIKAYSLKASEKR